MELMIPCIICDDWVYISTAKVAVCDKCKAAVMKIRNEMEQIVEVPAEFLLGPDDDYRSYSGLLSEE